MKLRVRVSDFGAVCRMVEAGVGAAVVPEAAARQHHAGITIRSVPLTDLWATRQLTICVRGLAGLTVHARQLVHHLTGEAGRTASAADPPSQAG